MATVDLLKQSGTAMLGTRPAARAMEAAMREACGRGVIVMDTSGVRRIGVSFFDEALLIFNELVLETGNHHLSLVYHKAPPTESLRNLVSHRDLSISQTADGDWIITQQRVESC